MFPKRSQVFLLFMVSGSAIADDLQREAVSLVCNQWLYSCAEIQDSVCEDMAALSYEVCPITPESALDNSDLYVEEFIELGQAYSVVFGPCFYDAFTQRANAHAVSKECINIAIEPL